MPYRPEIESVSEHRCVAVVRAIKGDKFSKYFYFFRPFSQICFFKLVNLVSNFTSFSFGTPFIKCIWTLFSFSVNHFSSFFGKEKTNSIILELIYYSNHPTKTTKIESNESCWKTLENHLNIKFWRQQNQRCIDEMNKL